VNKEKIKNTPHNAIAALILTPDKTSGRGLGTGFFVSPNLVVTCAHNIFYPLSL
jgi:V8-like Glu-specific endopeptidase